MIEGADLRAAVGAGLISEKQAADLTALAQSRSGAREALRPGDEPFELFRGFNEIFILVGLAIVTFSGFGVAGVLLLQWPMHAQEVAGIATALGLLLLWLLAEYFVRRRRMVAPAIALSVITAIVLVLGLVQLFAQPFMVAQADYSSLILPVVLGTLAMAVFWWRFRVPFAMAVIALGLFAAALLTAATRAGSPETPTELFLLSANGIFAWVTLAVGLLVFAAAMAFDTSDPHRVTRRASSGFWLHVVAAPAIVNTVALSLLQMEGAGPRVTLFAFLALIALVAIVIDRRSFLMAAIGYVVAVTTRAIDQAGVAFLILGLGVAMLLLGAFWERFRALILRALPMAGLRRYLPPSV
ncbi:hypothetical protein [Pseudoroseicyclus aestuarii]|uniref:Membrane protein DUF2157 n=1 Tax=Pseudoroseicyclus aestuarii TaxID=1795041 RepID=A0A318SVS5_9RHOB|nr:hypothetical protein [Pseudoroseicyclus aestuarii]PYE84446.1 hypothetical protein DFP88_102246 [Pseudoroseicyclus aestuarii]